MKGKKLGKGQLLRRDFYLPNLLAHRVNMLQSNARDGHSTRLSLWKRKRTGMDA